MSSSAQDLAQLLSEARVVILVTGAHPDGLVLHPGDTTGAVENDESSGSPTNCVGFVLVGNQSNISGSGSVHREAMLNE
jgi:hypothetical protein